MRAAVAPLSRADAALDGSMAAAARAIRDGDLLISELVAASLERIASIEDLGAFQAVYTDKAIASAAAQQAMLDAGYDLGPLHGLPISVKDNIDVAGEISAAGSAILRNHRALRDATVTTGLKRAGAIIVGHNTMHEFAWGGTNDNPHSGTARNPWDTSRIPAGSSGGSAIAVATRAVFASIGTDTGGSVRIPAAVNGITGLRPSIGRVSNAGIFPLAWTLDTAGPLAKSAEDCAFLLSAIAGPDPRDPQAASRPSENYSEQLGRPLAGLRLAAIEDYSTRNVQSGVATAFAAALASLKELGAEICSVRIPDLDAIVDALVVIDAAEPSALHASWLRDRAADYGADVRTQLAAGLVLSAADYVQAQRYRAHVRDRMNEAFRKVDALLTPTLPYIPPRIGETTVLVDGKERATLDGNMQFTALGSVPGFPALSVPMGFSEGLPVGLQIITPEYSEGLALRVGHEFQTGTRHHLATPPSRKDRIA